MIQESDSSPTEPRSVPQSRDAWERYGLLWSGIFVLGLILGLVPALLDETLAANLRPWAIGLTLFMALWHGGTILLFPKIGDYRDNLPFGLVYAIVLIAVWFALVRIHPAFYFTQMGVWSQVFIALPIIWATFLAIIIFFLNLYQQTIGYGREMNWWAALVWLAITIISVLFGYWLNAIIIQSTERKKLIQQLEETQAELARSERAAGIGAERQRLAHEIHDTLAQGFISIIMHLEAAEQALPDGAVKADHHLVQARQTARESLEQARRVVNDLRPEILERASFDEALRRVVTNWSTGSGTTAVFTATGDCYPLHPAVEVTLLRVTQEALANARKHAQASHVQVTLSYLDDVVILDVQDDGVGFVKGEDGDDTAVSGKFGLVAMRQRIEQLDGELLIESEPGEGTTVAVSIPIKLEDRARARG